MAATQRPVAELAFSEPSGLPAWKTLPAWAVVATGDKAAGADVIRSMAKRAGAAITEAEGSHVIMMSQPQIVTDVILTAIAKPSANPHRRQSTAHNQPLPEVQPCVHPDTIRSRPTPWRGSSSAPRSNTRQSSIPGREIVQVLTEIPCGVESGWHIHPGEEVGYIVAGTVQMMIQDQPTLTLHAGDGFLMTPRLPHNALDIGPDTGRMLSTYIVEVGQPLATFVDPPAKLT